MCSFQQNLNDDFMVISWWSVLNWFIAGTNDRTKTLLRRHKWLDSEQNHQFWQMEVSSFSVAESFELSVWSLYSEPSRGMTSPDFETNMRGVASNPSAIIACPSEHPVNFKKKSQTTCPFSMKSWGNGRKFLSFRLKMLGNGGNFLKFRFKSWENDGHFQNHSSISVEMQFFCCQINECATLP
jgi:hypothetical protein